jgi:hypothetical protein
MRGSGRFFAAFILVGAIVVGTVTYPWGLHSDNRELRAAMAKAGQSCGPLVEDSESWPTFDCTSAANEGYVIVFDSHEALVDSLQGYCQERDAELDQNDWITSTNYFVRSGSSIITTLEKHLDIKFYRALTMCYEL